MEVEWKGLGGLQEVRRGVSNDFQVPVWVTRRSGAFHWARIFRRGGCWQLQVYHQNPWGIALYWYKEKELSAQEMRGWEANTRETDWLTVGHCGQWIGMHKTERTVNKANTTRGPPGGYWGVPGGVDLDEDSFCSESDCSGWTTGINECGEFQGYTTTACLESEEDSG